MAETSLPAPAASTPSKRQRSRREQPSGSSREYRHRNQAVHIPDGYMAVGRLIGAHGLTGELRVELHTDFPERFAPGATVLVGEGLRSYAIVGAREHKGMILLVLVGVTDRTAAEELRGEWLFIPETAAMPLPEGNFWVHDIIGLAVVDETGLSLGRVTDVLQTGANDVYIIAPTATVNQGKELLIPATAEVVQRVDVAGRTMTIRLIPGLVDE
ncbi:MAG: 16S rRNA processing protein RimM [Chloroflexi bacterium]|nr:MAG: 16S rRNA processing protein RimM [Chloroflexota bacterium]